MAMIKCHECGKEISSKAEGCPHCGAKPKKGVGLGSVIMVGFLSLLVMLWFAGKSSDNNVSQPTDKFSTARGACLIVLKQSLNDPDSAKIGMTSEWYTAERNDGTILVQPTARAKNAFGAYVQGTWDCIVRPEGQNVRVLALKQIRP